MQNSIARQSYWLFIKILFTVKPSSNARVKFLRLQVVSTFGVIIKVKVWIYLTI
jgi:hypothetical protein